MTALVAISSFLAAGVEWVEALTIVLAVGIVRGWRNALLGTGLAVVALLALVAVFGAAVATSVSLTLARTVVGVFLLLFGLRWLHKAILRTAGLVALHDEAAAFEETRRELQRQPLSGPDGSPPPRGGRGSGLHWVGVSTSFNGVFLEGLEVVFIVIALGGLNGLGAASAGALASLAVVVAAGVVLRNPLTRVPENALKYAVGIMLTTFGTFFVGEGIGVRWWRDDLALLPMLAVYALASVALVWALRHPPAIASTRALAVRAARAVVGELWGLFVGDGPLAIASLAAVLAAALFVDRVGGRAQLAGVLLVLGVLLAVVIGLGGSFQAAARRGRPAVSEPAAPHPSAAPSRPPAE
jgi:Ca2+/H+ antiporter, TMEM165/GDT1 family